MITNSRKPFIDLLQVWLFNPHFLLAFVVTTGMVAVQLHTVANDPGIGWHLMAGNGVLSTGQIPRVDQFLASDLPREWISDQWLGDAKLAFLYSLGGWPELYGVVIAVFILTFFIVGVYSGERGSGSVTAASLAALIACKLAQIHFLVRPVIFGIFLCACVYAWCFECTLRHARQEGLRYLWLPCLLILAWTNLHPSFILGIILLTCVSVTVGVSDLLRTRQLSFSAKQVFTTLVISTLATAINPYGLNLHRSILWLGRSEYFMHLHEEWLPPSLAEGSGIGFFLVAATIVTCLVVSRNFRRSISAFELLSLLIFFRGTMEAIRLLPFFAVVALVPLARAIAVIGSSLAQRIVRAHTLHSGALTDGLNQLRLRFIRWDSSTRSFIPIGCLAGFIMLAPALLGFVPGYGGEYGPPHDRFPFGNLTKILQSSAPRPIVIAPPEWGGFLIWESQGRIRPIIDDRNTLLGEQFYQDFYRAFDDGEGWHDYLITQHGDFLLIPRDATLVSKIGTALTKVGADSTSVLYEIAPK